MCELPTRPARDKAEIGLEVATEQKASVPAMPIRMVLMCGGIGRAPRAPATLATIFGATTFGVLRPRLRARVRLLIAAIALGQLCVMLGVDPTEPDPQYVVIDELAGVWFTLLRVQPTPRNCVLATLAFRLLDKLKPGPIRMIEQRGGPFSLMGDDLVAGVIAGALLAAGNDGRCRGR